MKKVMVFGTFNIIHPGHLNLFRQAKKFGDKLYVVLSRNETVRKLKNYNPLDEIDRVSKLKKIPIVDEVVLGHSEDPLDAIKNIKPDIICLGYDQEFFVKELEAFIEQENIDIIIVRLKPYKKETYKSSKLI
jgi:FAD synthetase